MKINKLGRGELEFVIGIIIFIIIIGTLFSSGIFGLIFSAFNIPLFGGFGFILGLLFIVLIILGLFGRILGK